MVKSPFSYGFIEGKGNLPTVQQKPFWGLCVEGARLMLHDLDPGAAMALDMAQSQWLKAKLASQQQKKGKHLTY